MTVGDAAAVRDSLRAVELRVERRYANERAEKAQAQPPYSAAEIAGVSDWIAGVSFAEWFALTADRDVARAEAGKLRAALLDYGVHKIRCAVTADIGAGGDGEVPCNCGFTALTALAGSDAPPTPSEPDDAMTVAAGERVLPDADGMPGNQSPAVSGSLSAAAQSAERET